VQFPKTASLVAQPTAPRLVRLSQSVSTANLYYRRAMLLRRGSSFFTPTYPSSITQSFRFPHSPLPRHLQSISKHPSKPLVKRTYATQRPAFGGTASSNSSGGIPLGRIDLGAGKATPQKGIAIKDDISKSWKELSVPQKIVRTGAQTTNLVVVIVGVTVLVWHFRDYC